MEKCQTCGGETVVGNFCRKCGAKLKPICDCWVLKKPHGCGYDKCPGLLLHRKGLAPADVLFEGFASDARENRDQDRSTGISDL